MSRRHGYDPWTYGDVKLLAAELKQEAARRDIPGLKVGMLNYAWTNAYGEEAAWVRRHPEAFTKTSRIPETTSMSADISILPTICTRTHPRWEGYRTESRRECRC